MSELKPGRILIKAMKRPQDIKVGSLIPMKIVIYPTKEEKEIIGEVTRSEEGTDNTRFAWSLTLMFSIDNSNSWQFYTYHRSLDEYIEVYHKLN